MHFGDRIKELRIERNLQQKDLAALMNVSIGTISNYENNVHVPDYKTLNKLADYFKVTTDYLLKRTSYRLDPSTLNQPLTNDYTAADLVNTTLSLTQDDRNDLIKYLNMLRICNEHKETDIKADSKKKK